MDSLYFETNSLLQHIHFGLAEMERAQTSEQASIAELRLREQLEKVKYNNWIDKIMIEIKDVTLDKRQLPKVGHFG